jgi:hypothetical protein
VDAGRFYAEGSKSKSTGKSVLIANIEFLIKKKSRLYKAG